jgi:hypothetical protein
MKIEKWKIDGMSLKLEGGCVPHVALSECIVIRKIIRLPHLMMHRHHLPIVKALTWCNNE